MDLALRKIVLEGDDILRKTAKEITNFGSRTHMLADDMWETMKAYDGVGLAAPQVGVLRRIVVIDIAPPADDGAVCDDGDAPGASRTETARSADEAAATSGGRLFGRYELINPVIVETEGEVCEEEGCLSLPGLVGRVTRPARVKVRALDRNGAEISVEGAGLLAKALCHEIDHLNGVLFVDLAESIRETDA
ncbi:MAG: peptide deformylase [Clostridiales Family XIII bacterium]|jgi:peptide deformylase|nr:peptide deformylase [Clostridiales Family XIII bacterium]